MIKSFRNIAIITCLLFVLLPIMLFERTLIEKNERDSLRGFGPQRKMNSEYEARHFLPAQSKVALTSIVSVGIKTMNRDNQTLRQIQSIRMFYPQVQILISDDGPVDQSYKYKTLDFVNYLYMGFDLGASASRNALISAATTKYVVYMDDDMVWTKSFDIAISIQRLKDTNTKMLTIGLDDRGPYMGHIYRNINGSYICLFDEFEKLHYQTFSHPECYHSEIGLQLLIAERTFLLNNPWPFEYKTGEQWVFHFLFLLTQQLNLIFHYFTNLHSICYFFFPMNIF